MTPTKASLLWTYVHGRITVLGLDNAHDWLVLSGRWIFVADTPKALRGVPWAADTLYAERFDGWDTPIVDRSFNFAWTLAQACELHMFWEEANVIVSGPDKGWTAVRTTGSKRWRLFDSQGPKRVAGISAQEARRRVNARGYSYDGCP